MLVTISRFLSRTPAPRTPWCAWAATSSCSCCWAPRRATWPRWASGCGTTAGAQGVAPFSLGWANRHGTESLERTIDHADRELLQIRLFERRSRQNRVRGMRRRLQEE